MLNSGRLLLEKQRVRDQTDLTAISGGVGYARSLNVLGLVKKIKAGSLAVAVISAGSAAAFYEAVDRIEMAISRFGPLGVEAATIGVGAQNHLAALPLWNVHSLKDSAKGIKPDFNLSGSSFDPQAVQNSSQGQKYRYIDRSSGRAVEVPASDVEPVSFAYKSGKLGYRYRRLSNHRFVARETADDKVAPTKEASHSISLLARSAAVEADSAWLYALPGILDLSTVEVSGGNLDVLSLKSFNWGVHYEPLFPTPLVQHIPSLSLPRSGLAWIDEPLRALDNQIEALRAAVPELLH